MSNDRQVISYLSPAELVALMNASGIVSVHEVSQSDGKPVIHAALKVVNSRTGEQLPGGLPFSVVMFKGESEPGYSNIAIGTIVPAAELKVSLPRDYFNFCNQRFRFTRAFPLDESSFVIQMDLVLKNATREYVKFSFGLWGAVFSHMLFELMGQGRESLVAAAEAFAMTRTDFAEQIASSPDAVPQDLPRTAEPADAVMTLAAETIVAAEAEAADPVLATEVPVVEEEKSEAPVVAEEKSQTPVVEEAKPEAAAKTPAVETPEPHVADHVTAAEEVYGRSEHVMMTADPAEGKDEGPELTIVAGPAADPVAETAVAETAVESAVENPAAEAKDLVSA